MIVFFTNHLGIKTAENQHDAIRAARPLSSAPVESSGWYEFEAQDGQRFFVHQQWRSGVLISSGVVVESASDAMRARFSVSLGDSATKEKIDSAIENWRREQ